MNKPLILITNDDSIDAKGIHHLVDCVKDMGEIYVVAPAIPHSGQSSAFTVNAPIRVVEHPDYNGAKVRAVTGTPVDCVKLSMQHILPRRPDLVLSGINHGSNAGNSIIYSGTMGAVLEACMQGIPAVGYSLLHHSLQADFTECTSHIIDITRRVIENGLPADCCLNVNFPAKVKIEGMKVVRAARSHWSEDYREYTDPHGKPFYWISGDIINDEPGDPATDLYWLDRNYGTIVPAMPDQNDIARIPDIRTMLGLS